MIKNQNNFLQNLNKSVWKTLFIVYGLALLLTFIFLKFPNIIQKVSFAIIDFKLPYNWNHGFALVIASVMGYKFFKVQKQTSIFGTNRNKSILFSLILLVAYSIVGISNRYGINPHLWGLIALSLTLIYDIFEEGFWRGYLNDLIQPKYLAVKYTITGALWACWHLLIFDNFNQWGGFHIFLLLSILVSFVIGFATTRTNSILVAGSIHALLITQNMYVTLICPIIWGIMILTWRKDLLSFNFMIKTKDEIK